MKRGWHILGFLVACAATAACERAGTTAGTPVKAQSQRTDGAGEYPPPVAGPGETVARAEAGAATTVTIGGATVVAPAGAVPAGAIVAVREASPDAGQSASELLATPVKIDVRFDDGSLVPPGQLQAALEIEVPLAAQSALEDLVVVAVVTSADGRKQSLVVPRSALRLETTPDGQSRLVILLRETSAVVSVARVNAGATQGASNGAQVLAVTTPAARSFVNAESATHLEAAGTCPVSGQIVELSGLADARTPCVLGAWHTFVDATDTEDGDRALVARQTDVLGIVPPVEASVTVVKDTTPPTLAPLGAPEGRVPPTTFVVRGDAAVEELRFKWGSSATTDCRDAAGYGAAAARDAGVTLPLAGTPDGTYRWCAVGRDLAGNWQPFAGATTGTFTIDDVAPGPVDGLSVVPSASGAVTLSWTAPEEEHAGFVVVRRAGAAAAWSPTRGTATAVGPAGDGAHQIVHAGSAVTFTDTGLTLGTRYHYAVFAYDVAYNYSSARAIDALAIAPKTWGAVTPIEVDPAANLDTGRFKVARSLGGNVFVAYLATVGGQKDAFVSVRPSGGAFSAPLRLDDATLSAEKIHVFADDAGDGLVFWCGFRTDHREVTARFYDHALGWQAPVVIVPSQGTSSCGESYFMHAGSGRAYAFWTGISDLHALSFSPSTGWSADMPLGSSYTYVFDGPASYLSPVDGDLVMVWRYDYSPNTKLLAIHCVPTTGVCTAGPTISPTGGDHRQVSFFDDGAGHLSVLWLNGASGSTETLYGTRWTRATDTWDGTVHTASIDSPRTDPTFLALPGGEELAVWMISDGDSSNEVRSTRLAPGTGWSAPVTVGTYVFSSGFGTTPPPTALLAGGRVLVGWVNDSMTGQTAHVALYSASTGTWSAPVRVDQNDPSPTYLLRELTLASNPALGTARIDWASREAQYATARHRWVIDVAADGTLGAAQPLAFDPLTNEKEYVTAEGTAFKLGTVGTNWPAASVRYAGWSWLVPLQLSTTVHALTNINASFTSDGRGAVVFGQSASSQYDLYVVTFE